MDEWIEEDLALLEEPASERAVAGGAAGGRVLDQRMLREPIRLLEPHVPLTLPGSATVREAIRLMREHRIGCILVADGADEPLRGILTERDLLLKLDEGELDGSVADLMTPDPEVLRLEDPIVYALNKMSVGGFRHVPLVDARRVAVGIVSVKDIIDYIVDCFPNDVRTVPPDPARGDAWRGRDGG
ncbi:MAG TPA: CBS domain-containing protein [Candidatus Binatia bacterium]|jgi:CBS domain-containing protein|nr:CBS domain-containing protein [Candidatus Binatia bacterium]